MIKNVVFDIGRVLIDYQPIKYLEELGYSPEEIRELDAAVFSNPIWAELDRKTYTHEQTMDFFCGRVPQLERQIRHILRPGWQEILTEKPETTEFLVQVRDMGYKTYILSNFEGGSFEYIKSKYRFFDLFHGRVVSGHIGVIKPEPEIYRYLLDTYALAPEETVFIDDIRENLDAAEAFGIKTIQFTDIDAVRARFKELEK